MAAARRRRSENRGAARLQRIGRLLHISDGHRPRTAHRPRCVRVQAGGGGRDRRLRRHRFGVPLAGTSAADFPRIALRAQTGGDLFMANLRPLPALREFDLARDSLRDLNSYLHKRAAVDGVSQIQVRNPDGAHSIACGLDAGLDVQIHGHVGYYVAGMNKHAAVTVHGNAGPGAAENMMSGRVHVKGFASTAAGASAHGGLLIIDGDASLRCGISLKGADIVVGGSVGSFSAFMAQAGRLVICGDAEDALGDSLYEVVIYVRGKVRSLGADARFEPMTDTDRATLKNLLSRAGIAYKASEFRRIASAKNLYHWHADANQEY